MVTLLLSLMEHLLLYYIWGVPETNAEVQFTDDINGEEKTLQIVCPVPENVSNVLYVSFYRMPFLPSVLNYSLIAKLSKHEKEYRLIYKSIPLEYDGLTGNHPTINITLKDCGDSGRYACDVLLMTNESSSNSIHKLVEIDVYLNVKPGPVKVTTGPQRVSDTVGDPWEMTCIAPIGTNYSGVEVKWHWEYKSVNEYKWKSYPTENDITLAPFEIDSHKKCLLSQKSTLKKTLTIQDGRKSFRCYISRKHENGTWVRYDHHAAVYTVGEYKWLENLALLGKCNTSTASSNCTFAIDDVTNEDNLTECVLIQNPTSCHPYWELDLGQAYNTKYIVIYGRMDSEEYKSLATRTNVTLDGVACNYSASNLSTEMHFRCPPSFKGRILRLSLYADSCYVQVNFTLYLCELQVWVCSKGWYGRECNLICSEFCIGYLKDKCDRYDGACAHGCLKGWYGQGCQHICSDSCTDGCSQTTGECTSSAWPSLDIIMIIGSIVGGLTIVVGSSVAIHFRFCRVKQKQSDSSSIVTSRMRKVRFQTELNQEWSFDFLPNYYATEKTMTSEEESGGDTDDALHELYRRQSSGTDPSYRTVSSPESSRSSRSLASESEVSGVLLNGKRTDPVKSPDETNDSEELVDISDYLHELETKTPTHR